MSIQFFDHIFHPSEKSILNYLTLRRHYKRQKNFYKGIFQFSFLHCVMLRCDEITAIFVCPLCPYSYSIVVEAIPLRKVSKYSIPEALSEWRLRAFFVIIVISSTFWELCLRPVFSDSFLPHDQKFHQIVFLCVVYVHTTGEAPFK